MTGSQEIGSAELDVDVSTIANMASSDPPYVQIIFYEDEVHGTLSHEREHS